MRVLIIAVMAMFAFDCFSQAQRPKLVITKLTDHHVVYTTYKRLGSITFPSNSMYLVTQQGVVLIDTPWDSTQFQPLLDSIYARHKQEVVLCIATHFHDDRTAGLEFLKQKGIKTYTSKMTYELCTAKNNPQAASYFTNDTTFTVGTKTFETYYPGEGHSQDNIVIWFADERILFGGCLVKSTENNGLGNMADANLSTWGTTIENVMRKYPDPNVIIPGHFGWSSKHELQHTLRLLDEDKKKK